MSENPFAALKAAQRLPTPPGVALRILRLVQSEDASLEELTQVVSTDPALIARIMKYISSPTFGLGLAGTTLPEAVGRIGMRGVQMLALSFSLVSQRHRKSCPSFDFDRFWSQALARGIAARQLAALTRQSDPDSAFITGLVCSIGQLVYATGLPAEYDPIYSGKISPELALAVREHNRFGADHFVIGMALLKEWQLPETAWQTTGALSPSRSVEPAPPLVPLLHLAEAIAAFLAEEQRQNFNVVNTLVDAAQAGLGLEAEAFRALLGRVGEEWFHYGSLLSLPTGQIPDLAAIERDAEEHRIALRLASEMEISSLRSENEQLSKIAHRDRLTSLHNRRAFDDALPAALDDARASGRPVALLIADVDHFKQVNDTHGHPVGDAALRHLALILNDQARARDRVFRYGGEEFAIIATDRTVEAALELAEAMRAAVEATPCQEAGKTLALTISIGIAWASWPGRPADAASLTDIADQRLYDAKRTGRNRCCAEAPSTKREWIPTHNPAKPAAAAGGGFFKKLGRFLPTGGK